MHLSAQEWLAYICSQCRLPARLASSCPIMQVGTQCRFLSCFFFKHFIWTNLSKRGVVLDFGGRAERQKEKLPDIGQTCEQFDFQIVFEN